MSDYGTKIIIIRCSIGTLAENHVMTRLGQVVELRPLHTDIPANDPRNCRRFKVYTTMPNAVRGLIKDIQNNYQSTTIIYEETSAHTEQNRSYGIKVGE